MIYYSKTHEYVRVEAARGYIGVSDFAQHQLGNVVYVDLPEIGDTFEKGEEFGAIESVKAASDLIMPVSGEVIEVNDILSENPRLINQDPIQNWIIAVELSDPSQLTELMDREAYDAFCASESH